MIKVGLVQINTEFSGQWYFPYAAGLLEAFAKRHLPNPEDYKFLPPVFRHGRVADTVAQVGSPDVLAMSLYSWNERLSMGVAEAIKRKRPSTLVVCGGVQVPRYDRPWEVEEFHQKYPFIDLVVHGEGERPFLEILQHGCDGDWEILPSVSFRDRHGRIVRTTRCEDFKDLSEVPDPYTAGVFDQLVEMYPDVKWIGGLETNRKCPFACTFCSWPMGKPVLRPLEEVFRTLDRLVDYGTLYVFIFDANFGIFRERDVAIAEYLAKLKRERGLPRAVNVQDGKNVEQWVYRVRKALIAGGIDTPTIIALQSIHPPTLKAIKRKNIKTESYRLNQQRFAEEGILTMTDLILGLPEETRESFEFGVGEVISWGQHNRIHFNNLSVTPDAEMSHRDQRVQHGLETVWIRMVNMHGAIVEDEVQEYQELAIGTRTMPREDWVRVRAFGWMTNFLHMDKVLQIPLVICREVGSTVDGEFASWCRGHGLDPASFPLTMQLKGARPRYEALIGHFLSPELDPLRFPLLTEIRDFFFAQARAIQSGEVEYCHSPEWLDIYWPADEYIMIKLVREGRLDQFYDEAERLLASTVVIDRRLLRQAITLGHTLLKLPFRSGVEVAECDWNIFEVYRGVLVGRFTGIVPGRYRYHINWSSASWDSWERWEREVVWWCNRGGDYFLKPQAVAAEAVPAGHH